MNARRSPWNITASRSHRARMRLLHPVSLAGTRMLVQTRRMDRLFLLLTSTMIVGSVTMITLFLVT